MFIPFNRPYSTGKEADYILQAYASMHLSGDGKFSKTCHTWLEANVGCKKALLTHSCTAALEMAALLLDIQPRDEVIMPAFTFVSTPNAFVLRGGVPVFVDVRPDTMNIDEAQIEAAITEKTKAIVVVHYAGIACEMNTIMEIAERYGLYVVEDDAQGLMSTYQGKPLGSFGHLAAVSFHETKNLMSGEGGALLINDPAYIERAEIIREKGTNRSSFFRGEVDKYTWVDVGSSYLPSDLLAAILYAQLEEADKITDARLNLWNTYHSAFEQVESTGKVRRPVVPVDCEHNGHIYYLILPSLEKRTYFIDELKKRGINAVFHYQSLPDSPAGQRFGRLIGNGSVTRQMSDCLVRLPLWVGLHEHQEYVIEACLDILS